MSSKPNILLVDDEKSFYDELRPQLASFYTLIYTATALAAEKALRQLNYNLILVDLILEKGKSAKEGGLKLIKTIKQYNSNIPIIVVTKHNETVNVVEAMKLGAVDFFVKENYNIEKWKKRIDESLKHEPALPNSNKAAATETSKPFIGESEAILRIKKILIKLSGKPNVTVLITGETGVGKEVAAQYMHTYGHRNDKPFIAVNLTTLTKGIMESRLFGHRKGSFTDARSDSQGIFELADGGILFLDEIGEIEPDMQVKLLRFLENKVITPIGGEDIQLDVQIVAATNKDLKAEVEAGRFREDLFYRLNRFQIEIPPLRDRRDDLKLLLQFFLKEEGETQEIIEQSTLDFLLTKYEWPGNIRELVNWVGSACLKKEMLELQQIDQSLLPEEAVKKHSTSAKTPNSIQLTVASNLEDGLERAAYEELKPIENAFKKFGQKQEVADAFNMSLDNLRYLVKKHYKKHPNIFEHLPNIKKKYKL